MAAEGEVRQCGVGRVAPNREAASHTSSGVWALIRVALPLQRAVSADWLGSSGVDQQEGTVA